MQRIKKTHMLTWQHEQRYRASQVSREQTNYRDLKIKFTPLIVSDMETPAWKERYLHTRGEQVSYETEKSVARNIATSQYC